jgi:hypothetical protein
MKEKYLDDLKDIKEIMNRSSRFISLSGLSGISAGVLALLGAYLSYQTIFKGQDYLVYPKVTLPNEALTQLLLIALTTLLLAIVTTIYFTTRKTKKHNQNIWDHQSKRLLINLMIPLVTGGLLCTMLVFKGYIGMAIPLTLVFYGLSLLNASKYTLNEVRVLGLIEIVLGLIAFQYISLGLIFWTIGFGVLHIVYGIIMQMKLKS